MKKQIVFSLLITCFIFISCSKDESGSDTPEETFNLAELEAKLAGTWQLQSEVDDDEMVDSDDCSKQSYITFSMGNKAFEHKMYETNTESNQCEWKGTFQGEFSLEETSPNEKIHMSYNDTHGNKQYDYEVTGSNLKLITIGLTTGETSETYIKQ